MLRLALFAALCACAFTVPAVDVNKLNKYEDIPQEYRDLIPEEVAQHLKGITEEEKAVLKEVLKDYAKYKNEEEFLAAVKAKSESLYEKSKKFQDFIKAKVDALGDEAKNFVKKLISEARKLHAELLVGQKPSLSDLKEKVKEHMKEYDGLSAGAKDDFKKNFPILTSIFTNEKAKAMIDKYVQN